ncbi:type IV pilus secretin PilQ [bacterium]|nr:type IV pilus secretin PilQ [bacterium]
MKKNNNKKIRSEELGMKVFKLAMFLFTVFATLFLVAKGVDKSGTVTMVSDSGNHLLAHANGDVIVSLNGKTIKLLVVGQSDLKDAEQGSLNGEEAYLITRPSDGNQMVIEVSKSGTDVRLGSLEQMVSLQDKTKLRRARVVLNKSDSTLSFTLSSTPQKVRYFTLPNPSRVVVDFIGIKGKIAKSDGVRSANHPGGFRVVLDQKGSRSVSLSLRGRSVKLTNASQQLASFTPQQKEEKIVKAKQQEESVPAPVAVQKALITGVAFIGENPEILKIKSDKPVKVVKTITGRNVEFTILNAILPKENEQIFDAASLNGPVREVAIYNKDGAVHILAKMATSRFEVTLEDSDNGKDFVFVALKNDKRPAVAGYSETTAAVKKATVAQADMTIDSGINSATMDIDGGQKQYSGKKINLDFKNVDILDVLRLMSDISKLNIIAGDDVKGTITVRLFNIAWDEALDVILRSKSLGKEKYGTIIRVATLKTLQREKEAELAKQKAEKKLEPIKVRLIAVNYAMAAELVPQVKELITDRGTVSVDKRTNVLIVKDVAESLDKAEQLVEYLDTQTPQVLIEARIVEATSAASQGFGVEWNNATAMNDGNGHPINASFPHNAAFGGAVAVPGPGAPTGQLGFSFGSIHGVNNLSLTLNVMEADGKIKIVSSPKIATLDNKEAIIKQGVSIPITTRSQGGEVTTKYVDAVLELKATPHITAEGAILMNIHINKSEPDWSRVNHLGEPSMIKKEATTDILITSGDTVVIGGVYTNKTSRVERGVPFLKDIPILGWLFKSVSKQVERSELLIFLTPKIMNKLKSTLPANTTDEEG